VEVEWTSWGDDPVKYIVELDGTSYTVEIEAPDRVVVDGEPHQVDLKSIARGQTTDIAGGAVYSLIIDGQSHEVFVEEGLDGYDIMVEGERHLVRVEDERTRALTGLTEKEGKGVKEMAIKAPMPGVVVKVVADEGQEVKAGQAVVILEAMKMENEIRTPRDGKVKAVNVTAGQPVEHGQVLAVIE